MTEELKTLIENQINKELYSAYAYYEVAEYYRAKGLDGLHVWFEKQANEEIEHAEKFAEYLHDNDIAFKLLPIEAPNNEFKSLREPLVFQVNHEKYVTSLIHAIHDQAAKENDVATKNFIQWYVSEQMEEEKKAKGMLDRYDLFADGDKVGLYNFDKDYRKEAE